MISKPKILEFYHTLRKTWHFDIQGEIGPIKVRPNFDRPNFGLNFKMPSFPQSMIKFKYFYAKNHCQIEFLSWGKILGAYMEKSLLWLLGPRSKVFLIDQTKFASGQ